MTPLAKWRKTRKQWLVDALGGKCNRCGYNRYLGGLDFHHIDPSTKESTITEMLVNPRNTKALIREAKKCCVLCRICHVELHGKLWILDEISLVQFDESVFPWNILRTPRKCRGCPNFYPPAHKNQKYCTFECSLKCPIRKTRYRPKGKRENYKPIPTREELKEYLWEQPTTLIAKNFGVSDSAVGKWAKSYGLAKPPRGYWTGKNYDKEIHN